MSTFSPGVEAINIAYAEQTSVRRYNGAQFLVAQELLEGSEAIARAVHPEFGAEWLRAPHYFDYETARVHSRINYEMLEEFLRDKTGKAPTLKQEHEKAMLKRNDLVDQILSDNPDLENLGDIPPFSLPKSFSPEGMGQGVECTARAISSVLLSTAGVGLDLNQIYNDSYDALSSEGGLSESVNILSYEHWLAILATSAVETATGWHYRGVSVTGTAQKDLVRIYEQLTDKGIEHIFCLCPVKSPTKSVFQGVLHNVFISEPEDGKLAVTDLKNGGEERRADMAFEEFAYRWLYAYNRAYVIFGRPVD